MAGRAEVSIRQAGYTRVKRIEDPLSTAPAAITDFAAHPFLVAHKVDSRSQAPHECLRLVRDSLVLPESSAAELYVNSAFLHGLLPGASQPRRWAPSGPPEGLHLPFWPVPLCASPWRHEV